MRSTAHPNKDEKRASPHTQHSIGRHSPASGGTGCRSSPLPRAATTPAATGTQTSTGGGNAQNFLHTLPGSCTSPELWWMQGKCPWHPS